MNKPRLAAIALCAALLVVLHDYRDDGAQAPVGLPSTSAITETDGERIAAADMAAPTQPASGHREVAPADPLAALRQRFAHSSLRGSTPDGAVALDADGELLLDAALVRRFEFYLGLIGEFDIDDIRRLLQADLGEAHGEHLSQRAMAVFDRYLGLRRAIGDSAFASDPETRLQQMSALRHAWFGDAAERMFGEEQAGVAHDLARRAIERDPNLDADERQRQLAELDAERPATARRAQHEASAALLAGEQTRQFEQLGIDPAVRQVERAALWGENAAQRLATLDRQHADWQQRVHDYVQTRQQLRDDPQLDPATRQRALQQLRDNAFNASERARIEALEAIDQLPGG